MLRRAAVWSSTPCGLLAAVGLERLHQLLELARVLDDVDDRPHRRIVNGQRRPRHRRLDDRVDRRGEPLLLAQDLGIVDLADLEARPAGRGPELGHAAVGADFFRAARQQQQERAPRFGGGAGVDRQPADEVTVQQGRELGHGRIRLGHPRAFDQESVGQHLDLVGACVGQLAVRLLEPRQRNPDRGMSAGIERYRSRRRLANARELGQAAGGVSRERGSRQVGSGINGFGIRTLSMRRFEQLERNSSKFQYSRLRL